MLLSMGGSIASSLETSFNLAVKLFLRSSAFHGENPLDEFYTNTCKQEKSFPQK